MSKTFAVLAKPGSGNHLDTTLFIQEGFSVYAFVFSAFWFLYKRMWFLGGLFFILQFVCLSGLVAQGHYWAIILDLFIKIWIGFSAVDWLIQSKLKDGYVMVHVMVCSDQREAQLRFFGDYLGVLENQRETMPPAASHSQGASPWGVTPL